ncbi:hypothetical protein [Helicobacter pylori]|uniref:hypothetical protein n=1 Tax=Helicobacter pylori TaxID=210 RepID=UPI000EB593C3|nr:hypothetical protein [Helicobacter pylori]
MAFYHPIIQLFNQAIIQSFNQAIIQSFNQAIKQSSNQAIKQRYHTFTAFTKTYLKIPYFLLFPLSLTLLFPLSFLFSLTRTAFSNHLIP